MSNTETAGAGTFLTGEVFADLFEESIKEEIPEVIEDDGANKPEQLKNINIF